MKILIISIILFSTYTLQAKEISNQARLRKASYMLTGMAPTAEDVAKVESLDPIDFDTFFNKKIDQYLNHDNFANNFKTNILQLFRMYISSNNDYNIENKYRQNNAFDNLILDTLELNKPWRSLLTAQSYQATDLFTFQSGSELIFFQFVFYEELGPHLQNLVERQESQLVVTSTDEFTEIPLQAATSQQQQTLAGVITTHRFFGRYPTTKVNKNRARAAALFRVFLCDPMKPVVLTSKKEDTDLLNKALQISNAHSGTKISLDNEARHGTDPQCMACHYKLDPMAKVFTGSSLNLNPFATPGALVFKDKQGQDIYQEVLGFKELADAIVGQDDYRSCQVQHFWNWIIGEDIPLEEKTQEELINTFVDLDERPKDFIKHLVTRDEFYKYKALTERDVRYSHVRPIFQRCDSCHSGESMAPMLSEAYPFNPFLEKWYGRPVVEKIATETKILKHGAGATMPPNDAGWDLRPEERDLILAWIKNGAKDNQGEVHYHSGSLKEELNSVKYEKGFKEVLEPTFYSTFTRLLAGNLLIEALSNKFDSDTSISCNFDSMDRNVIGFPLAYEGKPIFKYVNPNYLRWWFSCLNNNQTYISYYYQNNFPAAADGASWNDSSPEEKMEMFEFVERHILGMGILTEKSRQRLFEKIDKKSTDEYYSRGSAMALTATTLLGTRHFLTY